MKKRFLLLLALLPISLLAAERLPDAEARRVLERVAHASQMSDFQGVYLQQHGEHTETIRVFHVVENGVVHERREVLYGPAREMVRHGSQVSLYLPEGARPRSFDPRYYGHLFPRLLPDHPAELLASYSMRRVGHERVAGHEADIFELEPRDRFRYPHRIWVHGGNGLLLKMTTFGFKHEMFDLFAFSQLTLGAQVDRSLLKPVNPVKPVDVEAGSAAMPTAVQWEVKGIPAGFRLVQQGLRVLPVRSQRVVQHLYSDGVASISVFLEAMQPGAPLGATRQGALSIYGRQDGGQHVTVLGEVPPETVELFSRAYKSHDKSVKK